METDILNHIKTSSQDPEFIINLVNYSNEIIGSFKDITLEPENQWSLEGGSFHIPINPIFFTEHPKFKISFIAFTSCDKPYITDQRVILNECKITKINADLLSNGMSPIINKYYGTFESYTLK